VRTLFYIHDPMCSWCWAFRPVWEEVRNRLPGLNTACRQVLGGLAPDTDQAMPPELRLKIQGIWRTIQGKVPGTPFNFDFWEIRTPRRATYPACRAIIAARKQDPDFEDAMILAIQKAYYLEARNPSDDATLIELAGEIGADPARFAEDLRYPGTQAELLEEIRLARALGADGFPALVLHDGRGYREVPLDYRDAGAILGHLSSRP
jgi:putative protein-disulfide isomerase